MRREAVSGLVWVSNTLPMVKCGLAKVVAWEPGDVFSALPSFATKCWAGSALENKSTKLFFLLFAESNQIL